MKFGGVYVFKEKNIEKREGKEKGKEHKMQYKRKLIWISFILWPNSL